VANNWVIVGRSNGNAESESFHANAKSRGFIVPRTDGFKASNIEFHNFVEGMILVESSSVNDNIKVWV
jgi:hypothetical protein